jgi:hypothetical protein
MPAVRIDGLVAGHGREGAMVFEAVRPVLTASWKPFSTPWVA